jgi:hypothetical protein
MADQPRTAGGDDRPVGPAEVQRTPSDVRDVDRDRTLAAVHRLEEALGSAAGRRGQWRRDVLATLEVLAAASGEEERNATRPESLLSDIARNHPRLRHRVHGLRSQYRHVRDTVVTLQQELADPDADLDVADVRRRSAWLLDALRHQRARESDLIYEALADASDNDLDDGPPAER